MTDLVILQSSDRPDLASSPAAVYLAKLQSERSRRVQLQALRIMAELLTGIPDPAACPWQNLRYAHTNALRARLAVDYAPSTARRMISALRGVLLAARQLQLMTPDDFTLASTLDPIKGERLPAGRALTAGELAALVKACEADGSPAGARDAALLACLYPGGLRRFEAAGLDFRDWQPADCALTVRAGKGNKSRIAYLPGGAARAIGDWLKLRGTDPGALLWPVNKAGRLTCRRLTPQAIYYALARRGVEAGIARFTPHDLRRTVISDLLDAGADLATVADLAGHARLDTTRRYDRRPESAKARAASLLHLPYRGRLPDR